MRGLQGAEGTGLERCDRVGWAELTGLTEVATLPNILPLTTGLLGSHIPWVRAGWAVLTGP